MESDIVERLRYKIPLYATYSGMTVDLKQAIEEIERLREERDEARREVCEIMHYTGYLCGDYANHRKWDCYNDGKHHPFSEEIKQNFDAWMDGQYELHAKEIKRLKDERDEARRAVCCGSLPSDYKTWKPADVDAALKLVAAQQGWDCFKDNTDER